MPEIGSREVLACLCANCLSPETGPRDLEASSDLCPGWELRKPRKGPLDLEGCPARKEFLASTYQRFSGV